MADKGNTGDHTEAMARISPDDYGAFIGQIWLQTIWLQDATLSNKHGPQTPEEATVGFTSRAKWSDREGGFQVLHTYVVGVESAEQELAHIQVTFGLDFDSQQPMTQEIFEIFEDVNLSVNTWPFLREFVHTSLGRMGWSPFTLPALKRGVRDPRRPARKSQASRLRARRKSDNDDQNGGSSA
jgi:hypothetical protein